MSVKIETRTMNKINKIIASGKPGIVSIKGTKVKIDPILKTINAGDADESIADERSGGILPLAALIPIIGAALGGAGGLAGGVAAAVKAGNDRAHQKELEDIAREKGVRVGAGDCEEVSKAEIVKALLTLEKAGFSLMRM